MDVSSVRARARPPIVDGLFYPAEKGPLTAMVEDLLARSPTAPGAAFAIVSPHAGYAYAGKVMASAYRALGLRPVRTAILIGPVHRDPVEGLFLPESRVFSTPLGDVPVDREAVETLLASDPLFSANDVPHLEEHCLEVQLPFLVHLFPHAAIVPILMGSQGAAAVNALTNALRLTFSDSRGSIAVVATANMASYMTGRDVESENGALEELIAGRDWRGILSARDNGKISACGAGAIATALSLAGEDCRVELLDRASSCGRDEEPDRAVHYAAVGVWDGALAH
jgi:AmmeMemoRadiSam system protein B